LYPTGGGVGLIAIWKAFQELEAVGLLQPGWRCRLIAVQTRGCFRLKRALDVGASDTTPWQGPIDTIVPGMAGPRFTLGDHLSLKAIRATGGDVAVVDDDDIMCAMRDLAQHEGLFICPEGASTLAAARALRRDGHLDEDETIVLLNTGNGLKYQEFVDDGQTIASEQAWQLLA
jgi:threonine synthase